jgi:hypothetical protein
MLLHEIPSEIDKLLDEYNSDGISDDRREQIEFELEALEHMKGGKLDWLADKRASELNDAATIKAEEDRLYDRRKAKENNADRLKRFTDFMLGGENLRTPMHTYFYRATQSANILAEDLIPEEFITIITERKIDRAGILKRLKAGEEISGAELHVNTSLIIK